MTAEAPAAAPLEARPLVSVVAPAYDEADILVAHLDRVCDYLEGIEDRYRWEVIVVDDGSRDATGELADEVARRRPQVRVHRHLRNFGLGQALCSGFSQARGDYVVVMDLDLTYAPEHIGALLDRLRESRAEIAVASPYMKGGRTSEVPFLRRLLSRWANRFLSLTARGGRVGHVSTLTGMVRGYDAHFLRSLNLKSVGSEINTEILYKATILGARVEEVPAHLDWSGQAAERARRTSGRHIRRGILFSLLAGFILRPFAFFIVPAVALAAVSLYPIAWILLHTSRYFEQTSRTQPQWDFAVSEAVALAFQLSPHAFIVGGILVMLAVQLFSLGVISHQVKQYFEELFHFGTRIHSQARQLERLLAQQGRGEDPAGPGAPRP